MRLLFDIRMSMCAAEKPSEPSMVLGIVREWYPDEGWGVLDSPHTPGGCSVLHAMIDMPRPVSIEINQQVMFSFEPGPQDGFEWRAIRVRPAGTPPGPRIEPSEPSAAYRSRLTLSFDSED